VPAALIGVPAAHGNLALNLDQVAVPVPAPARPPTLTLVPPTDRPRATGPAHHGAPAPLALRILADVVGWAGFAVAVVWVVIVSSGHGVASASAWAGSLFGLVAAAAALLVLTSRPARQGNRPAAEHRVTAADQEHFRGGPCTGRVVRDRTRV
jgi:hypothetical protein